MTAKLLTIIIPSYNMEKFLPKCLGSLIVAPELMDGLEVIIVNDGSKDRTGEIAHEFATKYPRTIMVIDKENGHYGSCVNAGLHLASGTYVKILDADDSFDRIQFESYLLSLRAYIDCSDACLPDLVLNEFVTVDELGETICKSDLGLPPGKVMNVCSSLVFDRYIYMHQVAYRTEMLRSLKYRQTEGICYTDNEWVQLPMIGVRLIGYVNVHLYLYLVGRSGQSIDRKELHKNYGMWFKELFVLLENCKRAENSSPIVREYVRLVAMNVVHKVYSMLLDPGRQEGENVCLSDLDLFLRENFQDIYESASNYSVKVKCFGFAYVKEWRRYHSTQTLRFMAYHVYQWLARMKTMIYHSRR